MLLYCLRCERCRSRNNVIYCVVWTVDRLLFQLLLSILVLFRTCDFLTSNLKCTSSFYTLPLPPVVSRARARKPQVPCWPLVSVPTVSRGFRICSHTEDSEYWSGDPPWKTVLCYSTFIITHKPQSSGQGYRQPCNGRRRLWVLVGPLISCGDLQSSVFTYTYTFTRF